MSDRPPQVISSAADETGAVTVSRLEFLTEVYAPSTPFNVQSFPLNPGLERSFPWLSQIAQNYDEYEFQQLVFSYRSTVTDIGSSTTGQCGTVLMATAYDPAAAPFGDKMQMMAYDGAMSCKTTESMMHGVECDPSKNSGSAGKYTRAFGLDSSKDIKDYDHGLFQFAVSNAPANYANNAIGELWVSYTVVLRKPKFFVSRGLGISRDLYVASDGFTGGFPFGTSSTILRAMSNNINTQLSFTTNFVTITFPADYAGVVQITYRIDGTGMTITPNPGAELPGGNVSDYSDLYASQGNTTADSPVSTVHSYSATQMILEKRLRIAPATGSTNNTFRLECAVSAGTIYQSQIEIVEINSGFSYRYANLGANDAPILVNSSGVVVVP